MRRCHPLTRQGRSKMKLHSSHSLWPRERRSRCGPVVRSLGLHAVAPASNPVLVSGLDSVAVVP